jgi:glutamine synthetase
MLAGLIAAGLDGIDHKRDPGPAVTDDLFEQPWPALRSRGIERLPQSLAEAVDALEADTVITAALGPTLTEQFVTLKREEWDAYAKSVTPWEMSRYAAVF